MANENRRGAQSGCACGLDEVDAVVIVLLYAGSNGKNIGVENDVLWMIAYLLREDIVGTLADVYAALQGIGLAMLIDKLSEHYIAHDVDLVLGMEARGFIFAPALAYRLNAGFIPVRKPGKLPAECVSYDYALEYGSNTLQIHKDAIQKGQRVLIVDDLLATGGTAEATAKLAESLGAKIAGLGFVVELSFLKGRDKLKNYDVMSLLRYDM